MLIINNLQKLDPSHVPAQAVTFSKFLRFWLRRNGLLLATQLAAANK
jgi:hypothetical protein